MKICLPRSPTRNVAVKKTIGSSNSKKEKISKHNTKFSTKKSSIDKAEAGRKYAGQKNNTSRKQRKRRNETKSNYRKRSVDTESKKVENRKETLFKDNDDKESEETVSEKTDMARDDTFDDAPKKSVAMAGDKKIGDDDVSKKSVDIAGNEQLVDEDASKKSIDMVGDKNIGNDDVSKKSVDIAGDDKFVDDDASKKSVAMVGDKKIGDDDVSKKSVDMAGNEHLVDEDASKKSIDMVGDKKIGDDDVSKKSVAMARDEQLVNDDASKKSVDMAGPKKIVDDDVSMRMVDITREKNDYLSDNTHQTLEDDVCSNESYIFSDGESDRQLLEAARAAEKLLENENVDISENIPSSDLEADADKENGKSGQIESLKMLCVENKDTSVEFRPVSFDRQKESEIEVGEGIQNELPLSPLFEPENNINETQPRISMEEYRLRNERLLQADEIHKNVTVGVSQSCATVAQSPNRTELEPNICDTELTIEGKTTKGK